MFDHLRNQFAATLAEIDAAGLTKPERVLGGAQGAHVDVPGRPGVINLCANNYLGLANHPAVVEAARAALERWG
jgi:glycine C-acetyltransferase